MTTSKTTSPRFIVDFINKEIIGTKASFDKASKGISPIYDELTAKMNAHPAFALKVKEQKHKSSKAKRTYEGMDFKFMENYISIQQNAAQIMAEYISVKAFAVKNKFSIYPFTKKWFLGEFDPLGNGFDMDAAKEAITNAMIGKAVWSVPVLKAADDETDKQTEAADAITDAA